MSDVPVLDLAFRGAMPRGPKEWSPLTARLLTHDELVKLDEIRQCGKAKGEDLEWLLEKIERLARLTPLDVRWPKYMALHNQISCLAYALRYDCPWSQRRTTTLVRGEVVASVELLSTMISAEITEAVVVVRPYVKLKGGLLAEERLSGCTAQFTIDGYDVVRGVSIEEILIRQDGTGVRRLPYMFHTPIEGNLFPAIGMVSGEACPDELFGIFLTNGAMVHFRIVGDMGPGEPIEVTAGLLGARYTTRPS